jgi:uncharacterized protein
MTTRRGFIASLLAATAAPKIGWAAAGNPDFLACAKQGEDSYALFGLTSAGTQTFRVPLPARGHAGAGHPTLSQAVVFARRPGAYALVIDCAAGSVLHQLTPPEGAQFNGHGVFLQGGDLLATSEQDAATSAGQIGLWDVNDGYARIGEIPTHGIGPHEMRLMPDGVTLLIANGGIATDATDRSKLNIPDMAPNLAYVTLDAGLIDLVELDPAYHQNSIRHLSIRPDGLVGFAMQWEGEGTAPPLLGLHRIGTAPVLAAAPETDETVMQGYAGSVAFSGDGGQVAITSPRGGRVHIFDAQGGFISAISRADVCGIAALPDGFLISDGQGALLSIRDGQTALLGRQDCAWDNHIIRL